MIVKQKFINGPLITTPPSANTTERGASARSAGAPPSASKTEGEASARTASDARNLTPSLASWVRERREEGNDKGEEESEEESETGATM